MEIKGKLNIKNDGDSDWFQQECFIGNISMSNLLDIFDNKNVKITIEEIEEDE